MLFRKLRRAFLRFAFDLFYNPFAFTYDPISAIVSRAHWRNWTRAAIPHILGRRVLEIPCGTGNLLLDLCDAGYAPIGVDLSSAMLEITRRKFRAMQTRSQPGALSPFTKGASANLTRARAQWLPFAPAAFDAIVMTFPPEFVFDPTALAEFYRILDAKGRLIWVDAARLLPRDAWSVVLNAALDATSGEGNFVRVAQRILSAAGFATRFESARDEASVVNVAIATKM